MRSGLIIALLVAIPQWVLAETEGPGFAVNGLTDLQYVYSDGKHGWLDRGPDKLRYDEADNDGIRLGDLGIGVSYSFNLQSKIEVAAHQYTDPDHTTELTEAYWQYRTLNDGAWRSRYRVGAFYPGFSLENNGPLWTSPYTLKSSAINTWIGEELRILGIEGKWTWAGDAHNRSKHRFSAFASVYLHNDTLGAMMSWRGWSIHDRQTGINGTLPLRDLPIVVLSNHSDEFEPFMEIDDRPGFYVGGEWAYERKLKLQLAHYDNQADDTIRQSDQYGWRTRFSHASLHWRNDQGYELLSQYMIGNTVMVRDVVDNDFEAAYVMAVKTWGRNRLALRFDYFRVRDRDNRPFDYNGERGNSQTISYSYLFNRGWKLSLEGTRFFSDYKARTHFAEEKRRTENQLTASVRYYF
jgi:hypothetical protein